MRKIVLILWLVITGWAGHFDEMFYANEPDNGYANPKYKEYTRPKPVYTPKPKQANEKRVDLDAGSWYFNALAGIVAKPEYDVIGSNIMVHAAKTLPMLIKGAPNLFAQADVAVMLTPLNHSIYRVRPQQYISAGAYMGYGFDIIDAVTRIKPRVGIAFQIPTVNFVFSGGVTLERDIGSARDVTLLADVVTIDNSYYINMGVRVLFKN